MVLLKRDLAELRAQRDLLLRAEWMSMSEAERHQLIYSFCQGYGVPPAQFATPTAFRAQMNEDDVPFKNVQRLLAPPAEYVTKAGRLNRAGASTLYLAGTPFAAVSEIGAPIGSTVSILACRPRPDAPPFSLAPVAMAFHRTSRRIGPFRADFAAGPLGYEPLARWLKDTDRLDQWIIQDETLGNILTLQVPEPAEPALYELTNAIREHIYGTFPDHYDGVQYPSVAMQRTAPNIALDARRWNDIEPLEVWVTRVTREFENLSSGMCIITQPLLWFGTIEPDGRITYKKTDKTLLTAVGDFKQTHGSPPPPEGLRPLLTKPYTRYRISYGSEPDRRVFDFLPAD